MQAIARAPGSCGELIQGSLNGTNFLVTCPVGLYSYVKVSINEEDTITISDAEMIKVKQVVRQTLDYFGLRGKGAKVETSSEIPRGKGMASSSADIAATIVAVARATGNFIMPSQIAQLALQIEPSDGIMYSGITLFDHVNGTLEEFIGWAPEIQMVIIDLGGQVDTMEFNRRKELALFNREKETEIKRALVMLKSGFANENYELIAKAATISSFANQKILYKEKLETIHNLAMKIGALGINVAHSGTVIGLMFKTGMVKPEVISELRVMLGQGCLIYNTQMVNGGVEVLVGEGSEPSWEKYSIFMGETYVRPQKNMV